MTHTPSPPPAHITRQLARAQQALRTARPSAARDTLMQLSTKDRDHPDVLRLLGTAAQACGDHALAIDCFRKLLPTFPRDTALHIRLGIALHAQGSFEGAAAALRQACELAPQSPAAWYNLGEVLKTDAWHLDAAMDAFSQALQLDPTHLRARVSLARAKAGSGDIAGAINTFREVLRRDPDHAAAWFGLADLNVAHFSTTELQQLQRAHARSPARSEARNLLGFALGKTQEQHSDYPRAFETFRVANAEWRQHVTWDAATEHASIGATRDRLANWTPPQPVNPELGREVIFIVSLPRVGSSLIEHMLASHPQVEGANEITDMPDVLRAETRRRGQSLLDWTPRASADDWYRLGTDYLARTARWRQHRPRFTDKNLLNWQWVGTITAMLPAARIVVVRRDRVETCLACFRQRFARGVAFSYDLDELADRCIDFMQLTRFWLQRHPARVFDLAYESLTMQPETVMRGLLDFCDLPFDAACLDAHASKRTVQSAPSAAQVREPLHRAMSRANHYGAQLAALRQRLQAAGL
ncbi:MAG TPA: sulfotransferase [Rhodanobacteraceae bacterium]